MKKFAVIIRVLTCATALAAVTAITSSAQTRSLSDIESKAYVIGLDSYIYGSPGSLEFDLDGSTQTIRIDDSGVYVGSRKLNVTPGGEVLVGTHDFTGNRNPEVMVASRSESGVKADIFSLSGSSWSNVGSIGVPGAREIRVFRQALTVKRPDTGAMCTWTWHSPKFDFKASDGSAEPSL